MASAEDPKDAQGKTFEPGKRVQLRVRGECQENGKFFLIPLPYILLTLNREKMILSDKGVGREIFGFWSSASETSAFRFNAEIDGVFSAKLCASALK